MAVDVADRPGRGGTGLGAGYRPGGGGFRAAGRAWRKQVKGRDAVTRDGRPVWKVKLHAIDDARETSEDVWVEIAGEQPVLPHDGEVQLDGLLFALLCPPCSRLPANVSWCSTAPWAP